MTILDEAAAIVGVRGQDYGPAERNLTRIADMWAAYLGRDAHRAKRDNLVDICGYAALVEQLDAAEVVAAIVHDFGCARDHNTGDCGGPR